MKGFLLVLAGLVGIPVLVIFFAAAIQTAKDSAAGATATSGTACIYQYSNVQLSVHNDLSFFNVAIFAKLSCDDQKRVLDTLASFPRDRRDEAFDRMLDEAKAARAQ